MRRRDQAEDFSKARARRLLSQQGNLALALKKVLKGYGRERWLRIDEAAELANMSVRSFQRRMASDGVVFSELVEETRAELAVEMLKDTEASLGQIATDLGYSTTSNFARAFQRWKGRTPSQFRREF